MSIWSVANQKGGVGKTTTAVTLAGLLAARGERVLLVDLDPQGSMTAYFGQDPDNASSSVFDLFQAGDPDGVNPADITMHTGVAGIDLMPASTSMVTLDRRLGTRGGMGLVVSRAVRKLSVDYPYVVLDCPPTLGMLMVNALAACERVLIPVQTEFLALQGLERMLRTLEMIEQSRQHRIERLIVPTLHDRRTRAALSSLKMLRERHAADLWDGVIPVDTRFRDASREGRPLPQIDARARGTQAYAALLDALISDTVMAESEVSSL